MTRLTAEWVRKAEADFLVNPSRGHGLLAGDAGG